MSFSISFYFTVQLDKISSTLKFAWLRKRLWKLKGFVTSSGDRGCWEAKQDLWAVRSGPPIRINGRCSAGSRGSTWGPPRSPWTRYYISSQIFFYLFTYNVKVWLKPPYLVNAETGEEVTLWLTIYYPFQLFNSARLWPNWTQCSRSWRTVWAATKRCCPKRRQSFPKMSNEFRKTLRTSINGWLPSKSEFIIFWMYFKVIYINIYGLVSIRIKFKEKTMFLHLSMLKLNFPN